MLHFQIDNGDKRTKKTLICGGRLAYVFLGKKKSPAAMQGFSNEVIREEENNLV